MDVRSRAWRLLSLALLVVSSLITVRDGRSGEPKQPDADAQKAAREKAKEEAKPQKPPNQNAPRPGGQLRLNVQIQPGRPLMIQGRQVNPDQVGDGPEEAVVFAKDRDAEQLLKKARKYLEERRYSEAVRALGSIVEAPEDFFFQPEPNSPLHRSLKSEAQQLLGNMPKEGHDAYELQFGARGEQLLADALKARDWDALTDVSRRFFHTSAGYKATYLLGLYHLDHDRPLAAALCFERLKSAGRAAEPFEPNLSLQTATAWRRAGIEEKSRAALVALVEDGGIDELAVSGREVKPFKDPNKALAWLDEQLGPQRAKPRVDSGQWTMYRGDTARNASSRGGMPLLDAEGDCWWIPNTEEHGIERLIRQLQQTYHDANFAALPALHPLAVDGVVLMRTVSTLLAVDFTTGKRLWNVPVDENWGEVADLNGVLAQQGNSTPIVSMIDQRIWDDSTYGTLSSNGRYVFSVEDLNFNPTAGSNPRMVVLPNGRRLPAPAWPRSFNRLAAHDVKTGKLKWELGGPRGDYELPLAGAFFLGPPLPLLDVLYVLAELNGEIRVVAIDAASGQTQWGQQLAVVELDVLQDPARRFSGVSPSYSDGVLICPTGSGAVVALDLTTRSLLWGYRYQNNAAAQASIIGRRIGAVMMFAGRARDETDRWMDGAAVIADGKVIVTPIESNEIHCLNLLDGELLWKRPRGNSLFVAGVHDGKALLVGRNGLLALKLADGEPAWPAPAALPSGSAPSGRGFTSGDRYYLPVTSAEVLSIDLENGQIVERSRSRKGHVPGNLLAYRGMILSQNAQSLETFFELATLKQEVAATLDKRPNDPDALAQHGALALHDGDTERAIADLKRSYELKADGRTRQLLADALFDGLSKDFAKYAPAAAQLEDLASTAEERSRFLRLMADGKRKLGDQRGAFDLYARLADPALGPETLERTGETSKARRDRWSQAGLAEAYHALAGADREHADALINQRSQAALATPGSEGLRQFLRYFEFHPTAQPCHHELAQRLATGGDWLAAALEWRQAARGADQEIARQAAVRLAVNAKNAGRPESVAYYCRRLNGDFADVVCLEGKTGKQWVAELGKDGAIAQLIAGTDPWPGGRIIKERDERQSSPSRYFPAELIGQNELYPSALSIEMSQDRQTLVGRDGHGRERWKASLGDPGARQTLNPSVLQARALGDLVVVSLGQQIIAIDTMASGPAGMARVLWTQELNDSIPGISNQMGVHVRQIELPWGQKRNLVSDGFGRAVGVLGPLNSSCFCFQRGRELIAVDSRTGDILWTRGETEPASEIFGDNELIFVVAPNASEAIVLRAIDGQEAGRRSVASANQRMMTLGRRVVTWHSENGQQVFRLFDPWDQKEIWRHELPLDGKAYQLDQELLGLVDPSGKFEAVNLLDGAKVIESQIEPEPKLQEIYLLGSRDRVLLFTNRPFIGTQEGVSIQAVPGMLNNPLLSGMVYAFDRATGKKAWQTKVEKQGLTLDQPRDLPILVFASRIYERQPPQGGNSADPYTSVFCINKRTGGVAYQERLKGHIGMFEIVPDLEARMIELKLLKHSVRMKFTDDPIPPEEAQSTQPAEIKDGDVEKKTGPAKADEPQPDGPKPGEAATAAPAAEPVVIEAAAQAPGPGPDDQSGLSPAAAPIRLDLMSDSFCGRPLETTG